MPDSRIGLSSAALDLLLSAVETPEAVISGAVLDVYHAAEAVALKETGLLKPHGHEAGFTSEADHDDVPVTLSWSAEDGGLGYFSPNAGWVTVAEDRLVRYRVDFPVLLARMMLQTDVSSRAGPIPLLPNLLWEVGDIRLPGRSRRVPVWAGRRFGDPLVWDRFVETTRARPAPGLRIVLTTTPEGRLPARIHHGHSIISVRDVAEHAGGLVVDPELLAARVASGSQRDDALITMVADGAAIIVRGKRYTFRGSKQRAVIRHLYEALESGQPDCLTVEVLEAAPASRAASIPLPRLFPVEQIGVISSTRKMAVAGCSPDRLTCFRKTGRPPGRSDR